MRLAAITAAAVGALTLTLVACHTPQDQWVVDWTMASGNRAAGQLQHLAHCVSSSDIRLWRDVEITAGEDYSGLYRNGAPCPPIDATHKLLDAGRDTS